MPRGQRLAPVSDSVVARKSYRGTRSSAAVGVVMLIVERASRPGPRTPADARPTHLAAHPQFRNGRQGMHPAMPCSTLPPPRSRPTCGPRTSSDSRTAGCTSRIWCSPHAGLTARQLWLMPDGWWNNYESNGLACAHAWARGAGSAGSACALGHLPRHRAYPSAASCSRGQ